MDPEALRNLKRKVVDLTVLDSELSTVRNSAKIYKQQPNSQIFFLDNKTLLRKELQKNLQDLQKQLIEMDK